MSWSKPEWHKPSPSARGPVPNKRTLRLIGAIAGLVALLGAITAYFLLALGSGPVPIAPEPPKTAKSRPVTTPIARSAPKPQPAAEPLKHNERMTRSGKKITIPKSPFTTPVPKDLEYKPIWEYTPEDFARVDPTYEKRHKAFLEAQAKRTWKTQADTHLAQLLFAPLDGYSLSIPFSPRFTESFLKSLETPIVVQEDDSPEVAAQKREMIETKIFLKEKLDAGEDIVKFLNEEYERQSKIRGLYRNLESELKNLQRTASSVEEMEDYIKAANVMLENAGGSKIQIPTLMLKYRLKREKTKNNQ